MYCAVYCALANPGPGNGCLSTKSSGKPSDRPSCRTCDVITACCRPVGDVITARCSMMQSAGAVSWCIQLVHSVGDANAAWCRPVGDVIAAWCSGMMRCSSLYLVLVVVLQRLDHPALRTEFSHQLRVIVVRLDGVCGPSRRCQMRSRFDQVWSVVAK